MGDPSGKTTAGLPIRPRITASGSPMPKHSSRPSPIDLGVDRRFIRESYEDVLYYLHTEQRLPVNVKPTDSRLEDSEGRKRLAATLERGLGEVAGYVLPAAIRVLEKRSVAPSKRPLVSLARRQPGRAGACPWNRCPGFPTPISPTIIPWTPWRTVNRFPTCTADSSSSGAQTVRRRAKACGPSPRLSTIPNRLPANRPPGWCGPPYALQPRHGRLHVFMPPIAVLEGYLELIAAIEATAAATRFPVVIEGYTPPFDPRLKSLKVTPDPGVIEVNIQPMHHWREMVHHTTDLYETARRTRLGTEKFMLDGRHTGTGGGNHIVIGGATPADSPLSAPSGPAAQPGHLLEQPPLTELSLFRSLHRTHQPATPHRRGPPRQPL